MIEFVKGVEPSTGFEPILALSGIESKMREQRVKRTKTVCTYCGVGCSFDIWTRDRDILKVEPVDHEDVMRVTLNDGIHDGSFIADILVKNGFRLKTLKEEEIDLEDGFMAITKGITN